MYLEFFGLNEKPFAITPDPRYLYLSARHADALAHLLYGISESGGFIQLTGEVGTGKTMVVRSLLEQVPDNADVALILNPQVSPREFLQAICDELGVTAGPRGKGTKWLVDALNAHLLAAHAAGRRTVVIVDEAQNLTREVLEQVRLLTNLETSRQKLLQIILIGQPELRELLAGSSLRQLAQRITGRYHLEPLSREDTARYIAHRLRVAGAPGLLFQSAALKRIFHYSHGVPRLINVLADRALLAAYTRELPQVTPALVRLAAREVYGVRERRRSGWRWAAVGALLGCAAAATAAWQLDLTLPALPGGQAAAPAAAQSQREAAAQPAPETATEPALETAFAAPPALAGDAQGGTWLYAPDTTSPEFSAIAEVLSQPLDTGTDAAFGTLFELWQLPDRVRSSGACEQARVQGLACLFQRGTLGHLLKLDLPAILTLADARGERHQLVLAEVAGDVVRLRTAGRDYWVAAADLSEYWFGDYLLLWRPHGGDGSTLSPGMRHDNVAWLRQALAAIGGHADFAPEPLLFDRELEERVRDFQRTRRLDVDGLAGPRTRILLQNELGESDAPRLSAGPFDR